MSALWGTFTSVNPVIGLDNALITRFMGPTWGPSGTDRTQVGPMLAPWTLLSGWFNICSVSCALPESVHTYCLLTPREQPWLKCDLTGKNLLRCQENAFEMSSRKWLAFCLDRNVSTVLSFTAWLPFPSRNRSYSRFSKEIKITRKIRLLWLYLCLSDRYSLHMPW